MISNNKPIFSHDVIKEIFEEFITKKMVPETLALPEMYEMYMTAKDEELYLKLKRKYHNFVIEEQKNKKIKKSKSTTPINNVYFIFINLGYVFDRNNYRYNGIEVIQTYITDELERGYTWFSAEFLNYSMSKKRVKQYNKAICLGQKIILLIGISEKAGGNNDICYTAEILEILSYEIPQTLRHNENPSEWHGESSRIWFKIYNIREESTLRASMFKITSTGADLNQLLMGNQYHFGYISLK